MAHQHKIATGELPGLLNRIDIRRAFHHADLAVFLPTRVRANMANFLLGEGMAVGTVADFRHGAG